MFTSRAEYRTLLRQDNADFRLTGKSFEIGLASEERFNKMLDKKDKSESFVDFFKNTSYDWKEANEILKENNSATVKQNDKLFKLFSRPQITMDDVRQFNDVENYIQEHNLDTEVLEQTEVQVKYAGYIEKEKNNADKLQRLEYVKIPADFDYSQLKSMSYEAREKLQEIQPRTVSQASRVSGVNPADISVLLVYLGR
jgi:tRNA uridine 5-carboxymethylaminomethyl modification enzyme